MCLYDFEDIGDPYIYPAEGCAHQYVKFRLVVFKPFLGEIITGKIYKSDSEGIRISLGFFTDIHIPPHLLQQPAEYRPDIGLWVWKYEEAENSEFIMNIGDVVSFYQCDITFTCIVICIVIIFRFVSKCALSISRL